MKIVIYLFLITICFSFCNTESSESNCSIDTVFVKETVDVHIPPSDCTLINFNTKKKFLFGFDNFFNLNFNKNDTNIVLKTTCPLINFHTKKYFFFGVNNAFDLNFNKNDTNIVLKATNGTIYTLSQQRYFWRIYNLNNGKSSCLNEVGVYYKNKEKLSLIGSCKIQFVDLPMPNVYINNKQNGEISMGNLLNCQIRPSFGEFSIFFAFDLKIPSIKAFTLSAYIDGKLVQSNNKGDMLSDTQKEIIKKLKKGDKVYFENIKAYSFTGRKWALNPIILTIK